MVTDKESARAVTARAREPVVRPEHIVDVNGAAHITPAAAVELLVSGTRLMATQAAYKLRKLTASGAIRSHALAAKMHVYDERDVRAARARLLGTHHERG